jgi:hypothetical protein
LYEERELWQSGAVLGSQESTMAATSSTSQIFPTWVRQTRDSCREVLPATQCPPITRHGQRGKTFEDPEWLIMLMGILAGKGTAHPALGLQRMTVRFWTELCGRQVKVPPIAESPLRERFKKSGVQPGNPPGDVWPIVPAADLGDSGQWRYDAEQRSGAGLAQETPTAGHEPPRLARAGSGSHRECSPACWGGMGTARVAWCRIARGWGAR